MEGVQREVFDALKSILVPYADRFVVKYDDHTDYALDCKTEIKKGYIPSFAAVKVGKTYISYHLMFVYVNPVLLDTISPELKKRMQGKACFNFKKIDTALFAELKELTERSYQCAQTFNWKDLMASKGR